jgi:hypothetical protein
LLTVECGRRIFIGKMRLPESPSSGRQVVVFLDADEHRMLTELAADNELSTAEWLRHAIRQAHRAGGLESLPQRIKRTWDALELEHGDYIRRCKLAYERQAPRPPAKALERRIDEMLELVESRAEKKSDMKSCLSAYRSAVARTLPGVNPPERLAKELQEKFSELWFSVDEWLDNARAGI